METISASQEKVLKTIVEAGGRIETKGFNGNTLKAFSNRGWVKLTESKKGRFVQATAKGKKALN